AEANHTWFLNAGGDLVQIVLRERAADAPLVPVAREPCGPEIAAALAQLRDGTPQTEFKSGVIAWLERWYRPEATLADAFAGALDSLLGPRGLVVLRAYDASAKRVAAPWVLKGLDLTLSDGYTPVLVEARQGRDRLQREGEAFVTRRSGERFSRAQLGRHGIVRAAFDGRAGELEPRLVRHELPPETVATLATLRSGIEEQYGRLLESVVKIDPTLERTVESARNAALAGAQTIEKKLVASLKRLEGETLVRQIARARAAVYPAGQPQERVLTLPSFLIRYGPGRVDALEPDLEDLNRSIAGMREELQFVQRLLEDPGKKKRPT